MGEAPSGMGGQSSWTMRKRAGMGSRVWYGGCPSRSSITTHPTLLEHKSTTRKINGRKQTYHISEAVVAPDCSITSGATEKEFEYHSANNHSQELTPVRTSHYSSIRYTTRLRSNPKVRQFNGSIFVREDIGAFDISMNDTLVMEVN